MKRENNEEDKEEYIQHLEKHLRNLEAEKQFLDTERLRLEQELNGLRNEVDRLREPPLVGGVIVSELSGSPKKFVVQASNGTLFVVNASRKVIEENLTSGTYVALNQRTFAITEKLPIEESQLWGAIKKLMLNYFVDLNDKV